MFGKSLWIKFSILYIISFQSALPQSYVVRSSTLSIISPDAKLPKTFYIESKLYPKPFQNNQPKIYV